MRTARLACIGMAAMLAAGCATPRAPAPVQAAAPPPPPPAPVPREVLVKVPVPVRSACVPRSLPPPPRYPDTAQALRNAGGAADRYQLIAAGRILRTRRLAQLERIVEGCR